MLSNRKCISIKVSDSGLRERSRELSILVEMSNFLSSSMNLKHLLSGALSKVLRYFDLVAGRIYFVDDEGQHLYLAAHQGMDPGGLETISIHQGFSGKSARNKCFIAQHVSELEDIERAALLQNKGFRIVICVPLIHMDKVDGVMNLAASKIIKLDQAKIDLLTTLGNQIAVAANNAKLYEELENKIELLKEKKEMIKFFAYSASHDLKSPAIAIHGLTKRLQEQYAGIVGEKGRAYCDQILRTSEQMVALVEEINAYIMTKEAPLNLVKIKIKEMTKTIRNEFSAILDQRQIKWLEPESLPEVMADKIALTRVFRNFVDNALKYGGEELFEIKIGYEDNNEFHIFSFSDNGVGLEKGDQEKIFGLFQRHETSKGTAGAGLGLSIVREIAERHRGRAWMESGTEKGTTFYISISKNLETTE